MTITKTIGQLTGMPKPDVYRRTNGDMYLKLNAAFHVKTTLKGTAWVGAGKAEQITDVNEIVEVI
jgi:hypothetical protein